jgi:acyl-CoA synthetase (AMP-forming)/AMP-acid ligase II
MPITLLADVVRTHAAERGGRRAMCAGDRVWTYASLRDEAAQVAQALRAGGVAPQDRVAVLDKNAPEYFTFLFGAAMVNAVTLAVNWRLAPREMEYILNHAEARVLLVGEEFLDHLEQMKLETVRRVVVVEGEGGGHPGYAEWIAPHEPVDPEVPTRPEDTCYQLYTSGTTGLPKGVELTHRNLFSAMEVGARAWSFDGDSVNLVAMPLFHIAGSGWAIAGFANGGENVLLREVDPAAILRVIPKHRITNALLVPAVLQFLLATPGVEETDFSSLRSMVYGASPISEEVLVGSMRVMGCGFVQAYGLTETTGGICSLAAADHDPGGPRAALLRSAGRPWGDVEVRIVDTASGKDVPEGEVGEIWSRTAQNMKGYWRNPEATREAFPEGRDANGLGWFRTGDAGYLKDGYVFIHDRVKDMIVSGGENIYPAEIENVLMGHPDVADVAVIGVPSERWGETVKALIVTTPGSQAGDEAFIAYCRERLAHYKCPTSVDRVDALPRNPSGKLLKTELRERYWAGHERRVN